MVLLPSHIDAVVDKDQIEREYLRVPKFALRALGFWPHDKFVSFKTLPFMIPSLTILTLGVVSEVSFSYTHMKNLPLALDALCPALTKAVTVVKFIVLLQTRDEVAGMLDHLKLKWINEKSTECSYLNLRATRISMVAAMILICFSNTASAGYTLRPLGMMLQQHLTGKEIVRQMPFKSANIEVYHFRTSTSVVSTQLKRLSTPNLWYYGATYFFQAVKIRRCIMPQSLGWCHFRYPYDEYDDPMYVISYIFIGSTGTICCFGLAGLDGIFVALCLHISAQFQAIQHDFAQLTPINKSARHEKVIQYSKSENEEINKKLKALILKHQETIEMSENMIKLFLPNIFSHFVSAALVLCCVSVNLLLTKDAGAILYVCYGIAAVTQLLIFCAGGNFLVDASYDIHKAAYFTDWYKLDIRNQRLLLVVIVRAQTPCRIVVPFFESSLQTFTTIMRAAGSYIALFRTFL